MYDTFTLDEAFDRLYEMALEEKLQDDINEIVELQEGSNQFLDALAIMNEAILAGTSMTSQEAEERRRQAQEGQPAERRQGYESKQETSSSSDEFGISKLMNQYDQMSQAIEKRAQALSSSTPVAVASYTPISGYQTTQRIQDMKFPQNIIFFIESLVKWIVRNVLNFIDKFSNIVRSLLGMEAGKSRFTKDDLKLKFERSKEVEGKFIPTANDAYTTSKTFADKLNGTAGTRKENVKPVQIYTLPFDSVKMLTEDYASLNIFDGMLTEETFTNAKEQHAIVIDTSKDLFSLKESLDYFFELFDQAYGSNDEKLFSIDDLEIMLQLFKQTYDSLFSGNAQAMEVAGSLAFNGDGVNAEKLYDNLLRTRINTDRLKAAYVATNQQINNIAQIIMNKNLLGAANMGVQFAFLSAATYEQMIQIIEVVDARLKEAKEMEKKLQKMKKAYENLVKTLDSKRAKLRSVSGIAITSILERKINDMYDGARYMTQTVQLRMSTLSLYISELNDTRVILKNLNAIPESAFKQNKDTFKKFKQLWSLDK